MITSGFFNSIQGDRRYNAEQMSRYFDKIIGNGVFSNPSSNLQVLASSGMTVKVSPGRGWINCHWIDNDSDYLITLDQSNIVLPRIDSIILRMDLRDSGRSITVEKITGTAAETPQAYAPVRNEEVHELVLAQIAVGADVTSISDANITDTRPNTSLCGWVTGLIEQVDTETLFTQYQSAYAQQYDQYTTEFEEWFAELRDTLSTSTLMREFTYQTTATTDNQTTFDINIPRFILGLDILDVYINGLRLIKNVEYEITTDQVILAKGLDQGQPIEFVVYKSIDSKQAESLVDDVFELQDTVAQLQTDVDTLNDDVATTKVRVKQNVTIETSSWVQSGTWYVATISDLNITASHIVNIMFHLDSLSVASDAEVQNITESGDGTIKLYAKSVPASALICDYNYVAGVLA